MATRGWSRPLSGFAKQVERDLSDRQKEIAAYALAELITTSPVDQGAYKGNHRLTVNGRTFEFDPDRKDTGGQATLNDGTQALGTISGAFNEVVIQNNAPYGQRLEDGWSSQGSGGDYYANAFKATKERFRR